jgi:hypothetical protein
MMGFAKNNFLTLIFTLTLVLLSGLFSCKRNTNLKPVTQATKTELLTKNNWIIEKFTSPDNTPINDNRLNISAKLLFQLDFQFRTNNQVRAIDKVTKQVFSGGSWALSNNEKVLNIDIPGIKDDFELIEISTNKMILKPNEAVFPVVDANTKVYMVFVPNI